MLELSVVLPGIRYYNWKKLYDSILKSTKCEFELVIVSPYNLPRELQQYKNIKLIRDFGSPTRCQQIGFLNAEGKYLTYTADDALYFENSLDYYLQVLNSMGDSDANIVAGKYYEIENMTEDKMASYNGVMRSDAYHLMNFHPASSLPGHESYIFMNVGLLHRSHMFDLGGFDCRFEATAMAVVDFSVRVHRNKSNIMFIRDLPLYACSHMPGITGDHAPINYAQLENDEPLYVKLSDDKSRVKIDLFNYMSSPSVWSRREFESFSGA